MKLSFRGGMKISCRLFMPAWKTSCKQNFLISGPHENQIDMIIYWKFHVGTHGATRPCRHEFHVVSHVNRVHFLAGMRSCRHEFHVGSLCKGPLKQMYQQIPRSFAVNHSYFFHLSLEPKIANFRRQILHTWMNLIVF